jgi:hypothetical protein
MRAATLLFALLAVTVGAACGVIETKQDPSCQGKCDGDGPSDGVHAEVPLTIAYQTPQQVAFVLPITFGDTQVDAILDTGSSGVRILPGVLAPTDIVSTSDVTVVETYATGVQYIGHVATARVTLGAVTSPAAIPVMLIDTVQCATGHPNCPAAGYTAETYEMKPDAAGHGYKVIVGTGMHSHPGANAVGNPIAQLPGHPSYVVRIPGGFGATTGVVEIGPDPSELSELASLQLPALADGAPLADGTPAWDDWSIPTCVVDDTSGQSWCMPGLFDTGCGPTLVYLDELMSAHSLPAGDSVTVTASNGTGPDAVPIGTYDFTVGSPPRLGLDEVTLVTGTTGFTTEINVGTAIFFRSDVYFDHYGGTIGLLARR